MQPHIIQYSEKSFAVIGNSKEIKDKFKVNGKFVGSFNRYLKVANTETKELETVAGWIFSLKHQEYITEIVENYNKSQSTTNEKNIVISPKLNEILQKENSKIYQVEEETRFNSKIEFATEEEQEELF